METFYFISNKFEISDTKTDEKLKYFQYSRKQAGNDSYTAQNVQYTKHITRWVYILTEKNCFSYSDKAEKFENKEKLLCRASVGTFKTKLNKVLMSWWKFYILLILWQASITSLKFRLFNILTGRNFPSIILPLFNL